ncbi:unnamed protein product [Rotaria sp. Silwood2]|nr:unnamed protein product [Rotaria sp. Silwood2]
MSDNNETLSYTPLLGDNQGRWYKLLSPIKVLTDDEEKNEMMNIDLNNSHIMDDEKEFRISEDDLVLVNESEEIPIKYQLEPMEEQHLSQKLSQLSTSSYKTTEPLLTRTSENSEENIPDYLVKGSQSFEKIIDQISSMEKIEELRQIGILIYQFSMINLQKSLWMTYWKAGMGQLKSSNGMKDNNDHIGPQLWPLEVQSEIKMSTSNENNDACQVFVTRYLAELDDRMKHYENELSNKKNQFSDSIQTIETFVQENLTPIRLYYEYQIAVVEYNYYDRVLELEYLQHSPAHYQKQIVKQLCHAKYQEEITREEFNLLKEQISNQKPSPASELPPQETFFNTIGNQEVRQKLHDQYRSVAEQAKHDMIQLYLSSAEAQMNRYHKQFYVKMKQFWLEQRSLPQDRKLSNTMIHLIEERYKNISESVKCAYRYKMNLMRLNSNHH